MSRLTRDGTAEPVSRDQILRHARGQGNIIFPVQLTTSRIGDLTWLIHTLLYVMAIRARGGLNPCARESKARTGRFLREKLISDHGHFSSYEGHMERRTGKIRGAFSRMHRAL